MIDDPPDTAHRAPDHVMAVLNWALHALFAGLWLVAVVQAFSLDDGERLFSLAAASCLVLVYGLGAVLPRVARGKGALLWVAALVVLWTLLIVHVPSAAYLAFPLFFLCLHVLPLRSGSLAVLLVCAIAVVTIGTQQEWTIGGVAGPTVAAAAAIAVAVGYRSLMDTRAELAAKERAAGQEAERTRLSTLNQILSPDAYDNRPSSDWIERVAPAAFNTPEPVTIYRARKDGEPVATLFVVTAPDGYNGPIELLIGIWRHSSS